jgi:hypothetical protein
MHLKAGFNMRIHRFVLIGVATFSLSIASVAAAQEGDFRNRWDTTDLVDEER